MKRPDERTKVKAAASGIQAQLLRAEQLHKQAKLDESRVLCEQVLRKAPDSWDALRILSDIAYKKRDLEHAEKYARRLLALQPANALTHFFLANILRDRGLPDEAELGFREALRIKSDFPQAWNNLGNILKAAGRLKEAMPCYRKAVQLKPDYALAYYNMGNVFRELKQPERSLPYFRRALQITPKYYDALNNLGNTLKDLDQLDEALSCYEQALKLRPESAETLNNMGSILKDFNRLQEADENFRKSIAVSPDFSEPHFGGSMVALALGDYERGWREYEWRWKTKEFPAHRWVFAEPKWNGEALEGRTLLLHCEQGYGDNIQFMRYVPRTCEKGGRVILELQKPLMRLARSLRCPAELLPWGAKRPHFDLRCSVVSLPLAFGATKQNAPDDVPYLFPDPVLVANWRERFAGVSGLKVGVVWAGNPRQTTEHKRGIGLDRYRPLFTVPGIRWFSLQVGPRVEDLNRLPSGLVTDLAPKLTDFAETAAAIANLDLVITTDTSVAHLAGALGHPAWVMLRWAPDWRWEDNCWYPTLKLFRQARRDDWSAPVAAARAELAAMAAGAES